MTHYRDTCSYNFFHGFYFFLTAFLEKSRSVSVTSFPFSSKSYSGW